VRGCRSAVRRGLDSRVGQGRWNAGRGRGWRADSTRRRCSSGRSTYSNATGIAEARGTWADSDVDRDDKPNVLDKVFEDEVVTSVRSRPIRCRNP